MTLSAQIPTDAAAITDFAESVIYMPRGGEQSTITALLVDRNPVQTVGADGGHAPRFTAMGLIARSALTTVVEHGDQIKITTVQGGSEYRTYRVGRILQPNDIGVWTLGLIA